MSVTLVSAFLDLGRENWTSFPRKLQAYFDSFSLYCKVPHPMVLFLDEKHLDKVHQRDNLTVIPINREWLQRHSPCWRLIPRMQEVLNSHRMQTLTQHRRHCPEVSNVEYTALTNTKVDFLDMAIPYVTTSHIAWTDFGYFGGGGVQALCAKPLRTEKVPTGVLYTCLQEPTTDDLDPDHVLRFAPEKVSAGFFIGRVADMKTYCELHRKELRVLLDMGYADDEQHIATRCCLLYKHVVKAIPTGTWFSHYHVFS